MCKVIQRYNLNESEIEEYFNAGYNLLYVVPETKSIYASRQIITSLLYVFAKKEINHES